MNQIKLDLGKDIADTARASGVPRFAVQVVNNTIMYSVDDIPPEVSTRFVHPGLEVAVSPLFDITMYGNKLNNSVVHSVSLSFRCHFMTQASAQAFAEQVIAQFQKGKWQRYHDPDWDTLLTGRSSILDVDGSVASNLSNIDPDYKIPESDWPKVAGKCPLWRWSADNVFANFSLRFDERPDQTELQYNMDLDFWLLDFKQKLDADNEARRLKEGDEKGWNSTAKDKAAKEANLALNKRLEANALQRGDRVLTPH